MASAVARPRPPRSRVIRETADTLDEAKDIESAETEHRNPNQSSSLSQPIATEIPLELVGAILEYIDDKSFFLRSRLVSRSFKSVADPRAFRTLTVSQNQGSRDGFQNLVNSSQLTIYVKEIRFVTYGKGADNSDSTNERVLSDIACIPKFANVNALQLHFLNRWVESHDEDDADEMSPARRLQIAVIEALANLHSQHGLRLQKLDLRCLITRSNESILTDEFKALLEPLTSLSISVVTNDSELFYHSDDDYCGFWDNDITTMLNTARNLTSLTLVSDIKTFYDWSRVVTFPKLEQLLLEDFIFGAYYSPEPFIIRHKETLRYLDLLSCWIHVDEAAGGNAQPQAWAEIFKCFEEELRGLFMFNFDPLPGIIEGTEDFPEYDGYVWPDTEGSEGGYKNSFEDKPVPQAGEGDILAFESLKRAIAQRTNKASF